MKYDQTADPSPNAEVTPRSAGLLRSDFPQFRLFLAKQSAIPPGKQERILD